MDIILTDRKAELIQLEDEIEEHYLSFVIVGRDLLRIQKKELWREAECNNFTEYLNKRWEFERRTAYAQIDASSIYGYLSANVSDRSHLPTSEYQIRPLSKLATNKAVEIKKKKPDNWKIAWERAIEFAKIDKSVITEKHVEKAVNEIIKGDKSKGLNPAKPWMGELELDQIYVADVTTKEWLDTIPEGSIDFVITDPPWRPDEEDGAYSLYEAIGRISAKALKPGGFCAVYLGKLDLPILFQILMEYLDYEWCYTVYYPNGGQNFRKTQYKECWRPIGIFRKPGERNQTTYIPDAMESKRDKEFHEWQQGIEPVKALIEKYTAPGQLVLDPFVGGGTGPLAAKQTGRHYLSFDIDATTAAIASKRLQDHVSILEL